jgi:hypothetical protein
MRGNSKRALRPGMCFTVLCADEMLKKWYTEVLNGTFSKYDFDTLSFDELVSLTSPENPDSLASKILADLKSSASLPTNNGPNVAPAENGLSQDQTTSNGADVVSTSPELPNTPASAAPEDRPTNQGTTVGKEDNATPVQGHSATEPSTPTQAPSAATMSTKRHADAASMDSLKRRKTHSMHQQTEMIDISDADDENANIIQRKSQLAGYAAEEPSVATLSSSNGALATKYARNDTDIIGQNRMSMEEHERFNLSTLVAVTMSKNEDLVRQNERLTQKNEDLVRQNERLTKKKERHKLFKLHAAARESEALVKIEGLVRENQKWMDDYATLKQSAMRADNGRDKLDEANTPRAS